jgi:hypothetical protein
MSAAIDEALAAEILSVVPACCQSAAATASSLSFTIDLLGQRFFFFTNPTTMEYK